MSQAGTISSAIGPIGPNIEKIDGDSGFIDANEVTIYADQAALNCGSSVSFDCNVAHTIMTLNVTDDGSNTIIGEDAGNLALFGVSSQNVCLGSNTGSALIAGSGGNTFVGYLSGRRTTTGKTNCGYGASSLDALTTGSDNCAIGESCFIRITSGSSNIGLGADSGSACITGTESNNILIGNIGVDTESNAIRLGSQGTQTTCFSAGITGVTVANQQIVTINSTTGQLGVTTGSANVAFFGSLQTADLNATGDGTQYVVGSANPLTIIYNDGGGLNANGTFTVPAGAGGVYIFNCSVRYSNLNDNHTTGYVLLVVNGTTQYNLEGGNPYVVQSEDVSVGADFNGTLVVKLNVADAVTMQAFVDSVAGGKVVTVVNSTANSLVTYFSGAKIG